MILPANEQYHHIKQTNWHENGEIVTQQDHFHPGTKEAVLKTAAHGNNLATTAIFQAREATKARMSSGMGLMVTAFGSECHVNELTDNLGKEYDNWTFECFRHSNLRHKTPSHVGSKA